MIRRYLREHLPLAGLLALFAGTFALVLSLYHLPTEPVAYASALCAVMGLIALIWGFVRYRRAHQALAHVLNAPHLLLDELPSPRTLSEADDQAIMQRLLHDIRAAQSDLAAYRQDSTDYFTAWVHQIKTPLSVISTLQDSVLPPPDGELFLRRYLYGETAAQLGARFAMPAATVRTRLHRARLALQKLLKEG